MRAFIACTLLVLVSAQIFPHWDGRESDRHAGYTFELHSKSHVMIIRDARNCYLLHTAGDLEHRFHDKQAQNILEDNLISHLKDPKNLQKETTVEALKEFHSVDVDVQCRHKTIFELSLRP